MKSEVLREIGLSDEQIKSVMAENGKDIEKLKTDLTNLTADRDKWKSQAETAEESLKKFEEFDVEGVKNELSEWKKKAENAEKTYKEDLYKRDFADALRNELETVKFSSESAKKSIMAEIEGAGLKLSDGKILGLNDLLGQIREKDASAFISDQEGTRPHFTEPMAGKTPEPTLTRKEIMAIKDAGERQKAIAENITLFS